MQRFHGARACGAAQLGATLLSLVSLAGATAASEPESAAPGAGLEERRVVCTPLGCRPLPQASWTWIAAFGTASIAAGWLGRRMRSTRAGG